MPDEENLLSGRIPGTDEPSFTEPHLMEDLYHREVVKKLLTEPNAAQTTSDLLTPEYLKKQTHRLDL